MNNSHCASPIYLDYNATCPVADEVQRKIKDAMELLWENPSSLRGGGNMCKAAIADARGFVAKMIGSLPEEITFTSGGTEANNMVIYSMLEAYQRFVNGDEYQKRRSQVEDCIENIPHIVTTNIEHPSVFEPLKYLESKKSCSVTRIPVEKSTGAVSAAEMIAAIRPSTCLITIMWANNETGVIQPVVELSQLLKDVNKERYVQRLPKVHLHTDAAQAIGKVPVNVHFGGGVDFLTIVGHKFYGPRIGALFIRNGVQFYPMIFGGGQENGLRPGTENTPLIVGLGEAARLVSENSDGYMIKMRDTRDYLETRLKAALGDDIVVHCASADRLPNTSSVAFKGIPGTASDLLSYCKRIIASTGAACHSGCAKPSAVLTACGVSDDLAVRTVRFSVGRSTNIEDIDAAIEDLMEAMKTMKERMNE